MTDILDADAFSDPDTKDSGKREVTFDGWGRYRLPDPDSGKDRSWTRVTTLAGTLEDTYNLERWGNRKVLEGIVQDRGLVSQAEAVFQTYGWDPQDPEAKKALNTIVTSAQHVAGAKKGADLGTELHAITELHNQGKLMEAAARASKAGPDAQGCMRAYIRALEAEEITILPQYLERIVCIPEFNCVGRMDNISQETAARVMRVFDLKTQKTMDFGSMKIAIQLALYANASAMFDEESWTWVDMPALDREKATVCWLPVLEGVEEKICRLYDVDLEWGWRWAKASFQTRKARGAKPVTKRTSRAVPAPAGPVADSAAPSPASAFVAVMEEELASIQPLQGLDWGARFRQAKSTEELVMAGNACVAAGAMTLELKALGKTLRQELARETETVG